MPLGAESPVKPYQRMKHFMLATGKDLREMFSAGTAWLEKHASDIDAMNVFPVPDGDCGRNMFLTMRSAMEAADRIPVQDASSVSKAIANGAMLGARGNSGVILSQFLKGLANVLGGKENFNGQDLVQALEEATRTAYKAVSQPVEGTILTVTRDVAAAARIAADRKSDDLESMFEAIVKAAKESVARTPALLPLLAEAGVVDAGGQGLYILLEGALAYLKGEAAELVSRKIQPVTPPSPLAHEIIHSWSEAEEPYGYCTQFLVEGQELKSARIRKKLMKKGKSLIVVGDESNVRVHIHTFDPSGVLRYAQSLGVLHDVSIESMEDQHLAFVRRRRDKLPLLDIAVVGVALGKGMKEVFRSSGATAVVSGGQTMNPSVRELVTAVESVPSDKVLLLPNNKNVILTASQAQQLTSKQLVVVPTRTLPQGIAALLAFNPERDIGDNARAMEKAASKVTTIEITTAERNTKIKGLPIKKGQIIAIVDDQDVISAGDDLRGVIFEGLDKVGMDAIELATIYYGREMPANKAEQMKSHIEHRYPGKQVDLFDGGQPHYKFIISLE